MVGPGSGDDGQEDRTNKARPAFCWRGGPWYRSSAPGIASYRPGGDLMSLIFLCYFLTFGLVFKGRKKPAFIAFAVSTGLSILMFAHHTTSTLNLNF
jgi:hypothetical protein